MKAMTEICDRLVAMLVPRGTALADECEYVYRCESRDCNSNPIGQQRMRRLVCASGRLTFWENYGCCCSTPLC